MLVQTQTIYGQPSIEGWLNVHDLLRVFRPTSTRVFTLIPPLTELGLIDQSGYVIVGVVIGIVVTLRTMRFRSD